jgi:hypothetical protein
MCSSFCQFVRFGPPPSVGHSADWLKAQSAAIAKQASIRIPFSIL